MSRFLARHPLVTTVASAALLSSSLVLAQAPTPNAPASGQRVAPSATAPAPGGQDQSQMTAGKWRGSKLMGVDIYGPDNQKVGDVTEVIINREGRVESVAIGVGGFLGLGSKDVAVPFEQVTWSDQPMSAGSDGAARTGSGAGSATTGSGGTMAPAAGGGSASGQSGTGASGIRTTDTATTMYPQHGRIAMTSEQLRAAPALTYPNE